MNRLHSLCRNLTIAFKTAALCTAAIVTSARADIPKPGDWKPLLPNPTPNYVNGLAYGDGKWVAVGDFGYVATSPDGIEWTQQESSAPKDWSADLVTGFEIASVAYGAGRWVACGGEGMVYTSTDGIHWSSQIVLASEDNHLEEVVYAAGQWTITGYYGGVITSADGVNWQRRPMNGASPTWALGYGDGKWVCIDWWGKTFTSQNGSVWSETGTFPVGEFDYPEDVHFANGLWVCANNFGQIFTSTNLANWTLRYDSEFAWELTSANYHNGLWIVAGGENGEGRTRSFEDGIILTSTDGVNWTEHIPDEKITFVWEVAYGGGQWLGATSGYGGFFRSENGLDWSYNTAFLNDVYPRVQNEAVYQNGMWIVPLQAGTVMQSTDGQRWTTTILDHNDAVKNDEGEIVYQADWLNPAYYSARLRMWFVGGDFGKLYTSPDGYEWSRQSYPGAGIEDLAEGNGRLISAGRAWDLFSSTDGLNWNKLNHPLSGATTGRFTGIHFADGTWVAVGYDGNIVRSTDGQSWTKSTVSGREDLQSITFADGLWVTAGTAGSIYWSTNLTTWTKSTLPGERAYPDEHNLTKVKKIDSTWLALGGTRWTDPKIYTSTDGKTWSIYPNILYPAGSVRDITKVGDTWHLFGYSIRGAAFVMSTATPTLPAKKRDLIFSDAGRFTVKDTGHPFSPAPELFERLPLPVTIGERGETIYVSFNIQRVSPFSQALDFTALQLSRSGTNLPKDEDLGFGNSGPVTYYGIIVEGPAPSISPDTQVRLDLDQHTVIARIDYDEGTVAMVVDPQSAADIESATRHPAPTNPATTIMLRAGHADTSYTYSRIAIGEDSSKVLGFTRNDSPDLPAITVTRKSNGVITLSWPKTDRNFVLQSSRDLRIFTTVPGIQENGGTFSYTMLIPPADGYYRLRQVP